MKASWFMYFKKSPENLAMLSPWNIRPDLSGLGFSFIVLDLPLYAAELGSRFLRYLAVSSLILSSLVIVLFLGSSSTFFRLLGSFSMSGSSLPELLSLSSNESYASPLAALSAFFYRFSCISSSFLFLCSSLIWFHSSTTCLKAFGS